ncbi:carbohydrate ABC transporter permease [Paenibacillus radicis (ex Xue et al. 2023)]|uniref:Sugar ABC transporter permease n=1 Tax=Paenibacillus radicis (ex Xue et al. 2023) TaxID=2972489 RepID=A0ABT1YM33_9BACL|nr:sugar ABC transporter permease [Paenibacillus radicis (ex Xue et al. 2023)]MCR8634209.1 sugar ABC transporter permease [Paenibacillus radicis (ex Xue et al. 2023)]
MSANTTYTDKLSTSQTNRTSRDRMKRPRTHWLPYILIAPAVLLIMSFLFYPMANVFYYSFQNFNPAKPYYNGFIGLDNFKAIFSQDELFYSSLLISFKWVSIEVIFQLIFGLLIALLLSQAFAFRGLFRSISIMPWAVSGVITSTMWSLLFNEHMGLINSLLIKFGFIEKNFAWLADLKTVFPAVIITELWRGIPFFAITMLAALQTIPQDLYESARVDGAGRWKSFIHITLPFLKNSIILSTLLRAVWEFNNVDLLFTMTGGGPANTTTTLTMYVANQAIISQNFGYGSALTVISFIILLIFAMGYLRLSRFGKEG